MPEKTCVQHGEKASDTRMFEGTVADGKGGVTHIGPLCEDAWDELHSIIAAVGSGEMRVATVRAATTPPPAPQPTPAPSPITLVPVATPPNPMEHGD